MVIDLDELEKLHAEAAGTPYKAKGDWIYAQSVSRKRTFSRRPMAYTIDNRDGRYKPTETAAYIVAACNSVPELIDENRALREKVRELEIHKRILACRLFKAVLHPVQEERSIDEWIKMAEQAAKEAGE